MAGMITSRFGRTILLLALASAAAAACRSTPATPPPASADTWAVVDGREIRRDEVEKAYRRTAPTSPEPSQDEALFAKLGILDELIVRDILLDRASVLEICKKRAKRREGNGRRRAYSYSCL